MMAGIGEIRQFQSDDAAASAEVLQACIKLDLTVPPAAREELVLIESPAAMIEHSRLYYLAVCALNGKIVGVAGLDLNEIRLLFVHPGHQRLGIGTRLLRHLEGFVPGALFYDVFVYSAPGAVGFYRLHGYEPKGEHGFTIAGQTVPTVFMTKRL